MKRMWTAGAAFGLLALAGAAAGEQKGEADRPARLVTPLKVQLVVTKRLGDKKLSSLSYSFPCNAAGAKLSLNLALEVPVPVRKADKVEFMYRSVGSNIECEASALADGRFDLRLAFEQSALYSPPGKTTAPEESLESRIENPMLFRTAKSYFNAVLRDGQTMEAVAGADPLTGEVVGIDVTLAVVK